MKKHPELFNVGSTLILSNSYPIPINLVSHPLDYRKVLTDPDWHAFKSVFAQLHLEDDIKVYPAGVIYFPVDKEAIWNGDSEKGLVYSEQPLSPLVQDLDGRHYDPKVAYKAIKAPWYIYLGFD